MLLIGAVCAQEGIGIGIDTSYVLMPPISKSCNNIVFTDSMYKAWNAASVENMKFSILKSPDGGCLEYLVPQFIKGENDRLLFCKTLNNDSLIIKEDFKNGFFVVEEIVCGSTLHRWRYLLINKGNFFDAKSYKLYYEPGSGIDPVWKLRRESKLKKGKFYSFYNKIKKQNRNDGIWPIQEFFITKFKDEMIESFVFGCYGCRKCIDQFYNLIGKNDDTYNVKSKQ